jgi:copper transport protein
MARWSPGRFVGRRFFLAAAVALAVAPSARAHAIPVVISPASGAVLAHAPREVLVTFDSRVRVGPRNAAVRNAGGVDVLLGQPRISRSRTLVVPLQRALPNGAYTVRWSIISDDGHEEEGVLAFAVGPGSGPPQAMLTTRGFLTWQRLLMRTLFFLGVLGTAGAAFFAVVVLRPLGLERELFRRQTDLLFVGFLLALSGSEALIQTASAGGTRFERFVDAAAGSSALGAVAAGLTPMFPRMRFLAWAAAGVLFVCPTLSGHAFDPGQPQVLAPLADLVHLGAAAVWLGGLAAIAFVVGGADAEARTRAARRFSTFALGAVVVVMASGPVRALTELSSVSQLWSTGYGRALLVKTAILTPLVGIGWRSRSVLLTAFARLRRLVIVELLLLTGLAAAVGTLTDLPPGRADVGLSAVAPSPAALVEAPVPPPAGAFVDARPVGTLVVGFALRGHTATVTLVGADGGAPSGIDLAINGPPGHPCGPGCYRATVSARSVVVRVDRISLRFQAPAQLRPARDRLRRMTRAFEALTSVVVDERRASRSRDVQLLHVVYRSPDRFSSAIVGGTDPQVIGKQTIVIGARRWDRSPGGPWVASSRSPTRVPAPLWGSRSRDAYLARAHEISFFDPGSFAWFRVQFDPQSGRPLRLRMIAAGRVVTDRFSGFDQPVAISPPAA